MQVTVREEGGIAVVGLAGAIAGRAAVDFERAVVGLLDQGVRRVSIDFSEADLITSAGIRVVMMLAQRTRASGGGTVLFALSDHVRSVLDVAGLTSQFQIADDERAARARLSGPGGGAQGRTTSKLTRLALRLTGPTDPVEAARPAGRPSSLTKAVAACCPPTDVPPPAADS